jgi:hypothetical protein
MKPRFQFRLRTSVSAIPRLGLFALAVAALVTAWWLSILENGNYCWTAFRFIMTTGIMSTLGLLSTGIVWFLLKPGDGKKGAFWVAVSFAIMLVEAIALSILPMKGE